MDRYSRDSLDSIDNSTFDDNDHHNRGMLESLNGANESLSSTLTGESTFADASNLEKTPEKIESSVKKGLMMIDDEILIDPYVLPKKSPSPLSTRPNPCELSTNLNIANITKSNIWLPLTLLNQSLNTSEQGSLDTTEPQDVYNMLENLDRKFNDSPVEVASSLLTIIEESFIEPEESIFGIIEHHKQKSHKLLENESPVEFNDSSRLLNEKLTHEKSGNDFYSIPTIMLQEDEIIAEFAKNHTKNCEENDEWSNEITDESTQYASFKKREIITSTVKTGGAPKNAMFPKTPKIIVELATPRNGRIEKRKRSSCSPRSPRRKSYGKTPKFFGNKKRHSGNSSDFSPSLSPSSNYDDDEYLTAESETEEFEGSEKTRKISSSSDKKLDMSDFRTAHQEWAIKYQQTLNYKPVKRVASSGITGRSTKLSMYANKLEKRLFKELLEKREICFGTIEKMINERPCDSNAPKQKPPCSFSPCNISEAFHKFLLDCNNYEQCGKNTSECLKLKEKKTSRYISNVNVELKNAKNPSPLGKQGPKLRSRRSLNKKFSAPRYLATCTISKLASPRSPAVDASSLRPVSELRSIFSPRHKPAVPFESKIPGAKRILQKFREKEKMGSGSKLENPVRNESNPLKKKKIVSPVGLYIRGKLTLYK